MSHFKTSSGIHKTFAAALLCALCLPSSLWAADKKIDLAVNGNKLDFLNSECPANPGFNGCVEVGRGSKNWIVWELDDEAVDDGWVLTRLQFKLNEISNPAIRQCVVDDFNVDPATGFATDFRVRGNGKMGKIWDNNDCIVEYEVAYLVFALNERTREVANSDPIIRNGGRN